MYDGHSFLLFLCWLFITSTDFCAATHANLGDGEHLDASAVMLTVLPSMRIMQGA